MANEVAQAKGTALSADIMSDLMQDSGEGTVFNSDEMQIPYIRLAQAMSPQVTKGDGKFIKGLAAGDIFNNLTNEYWDGETGLKVIPCYLVTKYIEWIPMEKGGGFVQEIPPGDPVIGKVVREQDPVRDVLPNGNEMVVTDNIFCLVMNADGALQPAIMDMKVTQLKVSRRWKTQLAMMPPLEVTHEDKVVKWKPPSFGSVWNVTAVTETNKNNKTYFNYNIQRDQILNPFLNPEDKEIYDEAKLFHQSVKDGEVKATHIPEETPTAPLKDDDIPF